MKKIKCYDCIQEFESDTPEDILNQMLPHYMDKHKDIMETNTVESKDAWMKRFYKDWNDALEI